MSIVVFDSAAPTGQAVHVSAAAEELECADLERGARVYSRASTAGGLSEYRLYRATDHRVLDSAGHPNRRTAL